jgi:hypothetical protein
MGIGKIASTRHTSVVYQKFLEINVSSTSRLRGVFSENRKILPHSIERQLGPGTLPSTAQKMAVCAKVAFSACTTPLIICVAVL